MKRLVGLSLAALSVLVSASVVSAQVPDMSKSGIEMPLKRAIAPEPLISLRSLRSRPAVPDMRKSIVEMPIKLSIAPVPTVSKFDEKVLCVKNGVEKVEPGKVHWHRNFDEATAAAQKSNKPVLYFAMLGNLDDKFC